MLDNIKLIKCIFYKCFFVGFVFLLLSSLVYIFGQEFVLNTCYKFYGIPAETSKIIYISFLGLWKILIFILFLVPALALECKSRCLGSAVLE